MESTCQRLEQLFVSNGGTTLTGSVGGEDFTANLDASDFISSDPNLMGDLVNGGVTVFPEPWTGWGAYSEDVSFTGEIILTYTYNVPEPSAVALLGAGLIGMALVRRRRLV